MGSKVAEAGSHVLQRFYHVAPLQKQQLRNSHPVFHPDPESDESEPFFWIELKSWFLMFSYSTKCTSSANSELDIQPGTGEKIPGSAFKASQFFPADVATPNKAVLLSSCFPVKTSHQKRWTITGSTARFYIAYPSQPRPLPRIC